tara:strand:- start:438 stop:650 length:213 start_codon:yes stop_codon:yes gene_type:complete
MPPLAKKRIIMSDKTFIYNGKRKESFGVKKTFDVKDLNEKKLNRLAEKGWVEVVEKPKPKAKSKPKPKKK